jgi:hypothetical protein
MNNKTLFSLVVGIALVCGVVGSVFVNAITPMVGGDFAGGIQPANLFTANASTNSVTPNLSNLLLNGAISVGGQSANNQITQQYTAVGFYPSVGGSIISGATPSSSATSTTLAFTAPGFSVGDPCEIEYNMTTSSLLTSGNVTAVNGSAVTTTISLENISGSNIPVTVTSTITGVTSTVKATCFHTGV